VKEVIGLESRKTAPHAEHRTLTPSGARFFRRLLGTRALHCFSVFFLLLEQHATCSSGINLLVFWGSATQAYSKETREEVEGKVLKASHKTSHSQRW
jgi:hypothetical protein